MTISNFCVGFVVFIGLLVITGIIGLAFMWVTDEENLFALSDDTSDLWEILVESLNGLLEIDNMGAFALTVDIWSHLWVPTAGLVTKMCTSSKKLFDVCLYRHNNLSASLSYESCFVNLYY